VSVPAPRGAVAARRGLGCRQRSGRGRPGAAAPIAEWVWGLSVLARWGSVVLRSAVGGPLRELSLGALARPQARGGAEQAAAADRAGITPIRDITSTRPARLLSCVVRPQRRSPIGGLLRGGQAAGSLPVAR